MLFCPISLCLLVGKAGRTLLGGLMSREKLTAFAIGVGSDYVELFTRSVSTCREIDMIHSDLDEIALSNMSILDTIELWNI